jgi:hypothetical protein
MISLRLRMLGDMQILNLAANTQESYVQQVALFARYFNRSPERLGRSRFVPISLYLTKEKKLATVRSSWPFRHFASYTPPVFGELLLIVVLQTFYNAKLNVVAEPSQTHYRPRHSRLRRLRYKILVQGTVLQNTDQINYSPSG